MRLRGSLRSESAHHRSKSRLVSPRPSFVLALVLQPYVHEIFKRAYDEDGFGASQEGLEGSRDLGLLAI